MPESIAMVTSGFPRISETFALNELVALERTGAIAAIFATKPGDGRPSHPGAEVLLDRTEVLPPGTAEEQASRVVERLRAKRVKGIHGYFAHAPAAVAERAAAHLGVPYSFSAHARDIRKVPAGELRQRACGAARVIACNDDAAGELRCMGGKVELVPHGVDIRRFAPTPPPRAEPVQLLAVGRLVEKKGFDVLIRALARLGGSPRLRIIGDGPVRGRLERAVALTGLADRVELSGTVTHRELPSAYADAHAVIVPSVEDATGDRDGLPNVVLEAMASGRPVVASAIAAIPSAIEDGASGVLVPPRDAAALAGAVAQVASDRALRERMGAVGRLVVERRFELDECTNRLVRCIEAAYA
jgi:glycosyltransferase involved in cell wall biosynthesis